MSRKSQLLGFLVTAVFVWIVARNVSLDQLVAAFQGADYRLVAPATAVTLAGYLLRSLRWQRIIQPTASISLWAAFSMLMMGFAANNLLPARLGEFVRAYLLRRKSGARKTFGMATVILERVCDGLVLIALLGLVSLYKPLPIVGQQVQTVSSIVFLLAAVGILMLLIWEGLTVRLLGAVLRPLPRRLASSLMRASRAFIAGLQSLKQRRSLVIVVVLSISVWLLEAASYLLITRAFGVWMDLQQQILAAILLLVTVNLGIMLPSAPGYVGTFQFFAVAALAVFGVERETALAIAISSHLMQYLLVTGIGLALFARENLSLSALRKESSADDSSEDGGGDEVGEAHERAAQVPGRSDNSHATRG